MTYLRSSNSRSISAAKPLLLCLALTGCSAVHNLIYPAAAPEDKPQTPVEEKRQERLVSGQFEWAVQNYEAGAYDKAIAQFRRLEAHGPRVPAFELIPYYLGMSYFRKGRDNDGVPQLEAFLKKGGPVAEQREARIALLLAYERLQQWDRVAALAAESQRLNLFQQNRTLLLLVWARALSEKGELQGARSALKEGEQMLASVPDEDRKLISDPDADLWGRLHFTAALLQAEECRRTQPRDVKKGKSTRRLYITWLESEAECLRRALSETLDLVRNESTWMAKGLGAVDTALVRYTEKIRGYLAQEQGYLEQKRTLERGARQELYRLLGALDETLKNFKDQGFITEPLAGIRKHLDTLIVSLSLPSSER